MEEVNAPVEPIVTEDTHTESESELTSLQHKFDELQTGKDALESDFGLKRAMFKEMFLKKEDELKAVQQEQEETTQQLSAVKLELERVTDELEDVKAAAALSESSKLDDMRGLEEYYRGEIASLKQVIKGATEEMGLMSSEEKQELIDKNEILVSELEDIKRRIHQEKQDGFLSSMAKTIHKKVQSSSFSPNTSLEGDNLEDSMRKAQLDVEVLRSVVMPLEEEIAVLKTRLSELQGQMAGQKNLSLPDLEGKSPDEKVNELVAYLKAEKAARSDLEMYVAVLNTQKQVLQEDAEEMKKDLEDVCSILEREKKSHEQLKQTWTAANDQFLESQRLMMSDLRHMESVLSEEQHRQITELQKKETERQASGLDSKENSSLAVQVVDEDALKLNEITEKRLKKKSVSHQMSDKGVDSTEVEYQHSLSNDTVEGLKKSESGSQLSINSQDIAFLDSGMHESPRTLGQLDGSFSDTSCTLTAAQVKAIRDPTPEAEARLSLMANVKSRNDDGTLLEGRRVVSDKEWQLLHQELKVARDKLGRPCDMCQNYETQLQSVQRDLKEHYTRAQKLERHLESEKQASANQIKYQADLEHNLKEVSDDVEKQLLVLANKVIESEKYLTEIRQKYDVSHDELYNSLKNLTQGREQIYKELGRLQSQNDSLLGIHSKHAQQVQAEDINLPNNLEEMQLLLLQYREEIISAKVAKEYSEQTLHSEIMFAKDQLQCEQLEKQTIEDTLSQEIASLQSQALDATSLRSHLDLEKKSRVESETRLRETEQSLKGIQAKSKQLIHALQTQVEEQSSARTQLEIDVQTLKSKVHSLQSDLDTSEAVQRDFVKLSQSLQVELEKIRQAETEVRWQHEEDIEDCANCKQAFSVTRRKHHCRHCGRIFCADCISKSVPSGPNMRISKVCDVCHTILVNDATPYFSTEVPQTPG